MFRRERVQDLEHLESPAGAEYRWTGSRIDLALMDELREIGWRDELGWIEVADGRVIDGWRRLVALRILLHLHPERGGLTFPVLWHGQ